MSNELVRLSRPDPNADLIDQLESVSQRTSVAALDALLGIVPRGETGFATAAATLGRLSKHVMNAAQQLEPALAVGG